MLSKDSADLHFESTSDAGIDLRCGSMVETKHPAESLGVLDGVRRRFGTVVLLDPPIIDPLVIPLLMIVRGVFASGLSQRPFAEADRSIKALVLDRSDKSLGVGVQVGRTVRQAYECAAGILQEIPERHGELRIPVEDEEPFLSERAIDGIGEVPTRRPPDLDGEEFGSGEYAPVGFEELAPRRSFAAIGSEVDSVLLQDVADRRAADSMPNVLECPMDSRLPPSAILPCHLDNQAGDDLHDLRSTDRLAAHRKSLTLLVGQSESLAPELLLQGTALLPEIVSDRVLLSRDPSGHGGHENLSGVEYNRHPQIVARSKTDRQLST